MLPDSVRQALLSSLSSTYEAIPAGALTIPLGDSIDAGNDIAGYYSAGSIYGDTCLRSNQQMRWLRNAGVPGNTTTQALARIQTDVIDYAPGVCIIGGGVTNDMGAGWPGHTVPRANIAAMSAALRAAGIAPVLRLCPPADTAGGFASVALRRAAIAQHNAWCRTWGPANGIPILDYYTPLVDDATGGYVAAYTTDGIHPNTSAGLDAVSTYLIAQGLPAVFNGVPNLAGYVGDGADLLAGIGLFTGAESGGVAAPWTHYGNDSVKAVEADATIPGNWQTISGGSSSNYVIESPPISTGFSEGDVIEFSARIQKLSAISTTVRLRFRNGATTQIAEINTCAGPRAISGIASGRLTVPATTADMKVQITANAGASLKVAQVTVSNLTTLGIV